MFIVLFVVAVIAVAVLVIVAGKFYRSEYICIMRLTVVQGWGCIQHYYLFHDCIHAEKKKKSS